MFKKIKTLGLLASLLLVTACHHKSTDSAAPLPILNQTTAVQKLWSIAAGSGIKKGFIRNTPAQVGDQIYIPDYSGKITAVDAQTGRKRWVSVIKKSHIVSGIGADNNLLVVGTKEGEVIALNRDNGKILWRVPVANEVIANPNLNASLVLVKTMDDHLYALNKQTGAAVWNYKEPTPGLILRGSHAIQVANGFVVAGFANGELGVFRVNDGQLIWKHPIAQPQGISIVEQMVDINGSLAVSDGTIYVATYQGVITALNLRSGQPLWAHDLSSYAGLTIDGSNVYVVDANSHIIAFNRRGGQKIWEQTNLFGRNLTTPAVAGNAVVVGDGKGYVHWLSVADGHFLARASTGKNPLIAAPIVSGNDVYIYTSSGQLIKFRLALQ